MPDENMVLSLTIAAPTSEETSGPEPPILARVARGEDAAFRDCLARYGRLVHGIARKMLRDPRDIEEACQDVFFAIWRSAASYDPARGSEPTFVALVARRRLVDRQRTAAGRPLPTVDAREEPVAATMESFVDARAAVGALAAFGEDQRKVIVMAAVHGMTHAEIARELALPLGTVKSHYLRGIERVKQALEKKKR